MKKIEYYLHLYLGCEVKYYQNERGSVLTNPVLTNLSPHMLEFPLLYPKLKLILRPLGSMTRNEAIEIFSTSDIGISGAFTPTQFIKLLFKHFDLFGLIESGFAIDAKTLNKYNAIDLI